MWHLKYGKMNLFTKQKQTHRHREQTCGCQGGRGWEREGLGVSTSTLHGIETDATNISIIDDRT